MTAFWQGNVVSSRFQVTVKIRELVRNISCHIEQLTSDLWFCVQKGGMVFWKTFTVVVLLDWFLQMEEIDRGLSFPMY